MSLPLAITVSLVESSMDIAESDRSTQLWVNVTHGYVESYAYVRYSTSSGTARGKLFVNFVQWFIIPIP